MHAVHVHSCRQLKRDDVKAYDYNKNKITVL